MNQVKLALNICTYKREQILLKNLNVLKESEFFNSTNTHYYNKLEIFVVDNASELSIESFPKLHLFHNPNTGGSGGFQRGIEEIRKYDDFSHVIFMDDDVSFEMSSFYLLYDFLESVDIENSDRPIAGRMFDKDNPNIQWTAAEKWNSGDIKHVEFLRDISDPNNPYFPGKVNYDADADYGGFWFCCYPYCFVKEHDLFPFFLHCDDVEYGLRCGRNPIIIEGVQVWHETWEKRMTPSIIYYDVRNALFVNSMYGLLADTYKILGDIQRKCDYYIEINNKLSAYMLLKGYMDFTRGFKWLCSVDANKLNTRLINSYKLPKLILDLLIYMYKHKLFGKKI